MQVTQVTIVTSTAKAHLVADAAGRQGWIQNRSLKADSTVNTTTFDKAAAEFTGRVQAKAEAAAFANDFHLIGLVQRETDKAIAVQADWDEHCSDQSGKSLVWFPKSQLVDGQAKGWLIEAKARELRERLTRMNATFEIAIGNNTFWM
jgi:hypothetical protein